VAGTPKPNITLAMKMAAWPCSGLFIHIGFWVNNGCKDAKKTPASQRAAGTFLYDNVNNSFCTDNMHVVRQPEEYSPLVSIDYIVEPI
jgi:hypothetical protein